MNSVLIDTDIVLDFFFDRKPYSDDASQIFSLCESKRINGYITPVICSNVYYILRQAAKHQKVIEKLSQLLTIMDVISIEKNVILQALSSGFNDFEDALQNFAAKNSGIVDVIVTRNVKDYKHSELGVLTPGSYLKIIAANL